jgi:hypothetical protein
MLIGRTNKDKHSVKSNLFLDFIFCQVNLL